MATKSVFTVYLFIALVVVAVNAFIDDEDERDTEFDLDFIKRDPVMTDMLYAEKRGRNLKKYKSCVVYGQQCQCSRRSGRTVVCYGAGGQNGVGGVLKK